MHMMNPVFHDVSDLREATGLPVLGAVSMTWVERHHAERKSELTSYALVGCVLIASFVAVFLFRGPGGSFIRQLVG